MSKLKKEELLEWLDNFKYGWSYYPKASLYKKGLVEQAYQQIKELIQKPGITDAWIEEKAGELFAKHSIGFPTPKMIEILKDFIHLFIEEIHGRK